MPGSRPPEKKNTPGNEGSRFADAGSAARKHLAVALDTLKSRMSGLARRLGFHAAALLCALLLSQGEAWDSFCAYIGLLCLIPSGFVLGELCFLFPTAIGLGYLFPLWVWGDFPLAQALFVAGLQSWLLGAIIRRFSLGSNWLVFPFLLVGAVGALQDTFPFSSFVFATLCGTAAYACAAWYVRGREQAKAEAAKQAAPLKKRGEFAEFGTSLALLRKKKKRLAPELHGHTDTLVRAAGDILACMRENLNTRPAGTRFLTRYLPAAHIILDEHIRLRESVGHAHVQKSLESGALMLERLAVAFQTEHGHLLRDDTMHFNAEITMLDKLLKMDGR
jgi:hypothetical protein